MSEVAEPTPTTPSPSPALNPVAKAAKASAIAQKLASRAAEGAPETPLGSADTSSAETSTTSAESEAPSAEPAKSRADMIRERLAERSQARQQREASAAENREVAQLRAELERHRGQAGVGEWMEKLRRDPVAALREAKAEPRQILELLTKDAIAPGSVKQGVDHSEAVKQANDRAERLERQFNQYLQEQAIAAERSAFGDFAGDSKKYPNLAKLPPELRIVKGVRKWAELQAHGHEYDRELIADAIEADYEEEDKFLRAEKKAAKTSSATVEEPKLAASKKPAKTITADMAASAGAPRTRTPDERKAHIVEKLRQKAEKQISNG